MSQVMNLTYEFGNASVYDIKEMNKSFATGSLKVMYVGNNRNGSSISKKAVKAALPSLRNVPIVAHWDSEAGEIGGHDVEVVMDDSGNMRLKNLTEPLGVVPESATFEFATEADANGVEHEYLVVNNVILWKRQDVYRHIVNDLGGVVGHSMEISVLDGASDKKTGIYNINKFEFQALCLLEAATPCYEGSELSVFSANDFKSKMEQMMAELKDSIIQFSTSEEEAEDIHPQKNDYVMEGGEVLDERLALVEEYGLSVDALDFEINDYELDALREKFEAMKAEAAETPVDAEAEVAEFAEDAAPAEPVAEAAEFAEAEVQAEPAEAEEFALNSNLREALRDAVCGVMHMFPWGEDHRYWMVDFDEAAAEVYCEDCLEHKLVAFGYTMNGDAVSVDFENGKRVKWAIVEYDEGEQVLPFAGMLEDIEQRYSENEAQWSEKYQAASDTIRSMEIELNELRQFKKDIEESNASAQREEVFSRFEDLCGIEAFEKLKENGTDYDITALEEKCFAIRGRNIATLKFSAENKAPKLKVEMGGQAESEPYGGLFTKYSAVKD